MSSINPPANAPTTLPDLWLHENVSAPQRVEWPAPLARYVHRLGETERATIRITAPRVGDVPLGLGRISEGLFRIAKLGERGVLPWASAHHVARVLHAGMFSIHPVGLRNSKRGWEALATLAVLGYLEVSIAATPTEDDPQHFRPMPLAERLAELEAA
jgi:hypothetical protein